MDIYSTLIGKQTQNSSCNLFCGLRWSPSSLSFGSYEHHLNWKRFGQDHHHKHSRNTIQLLSVRFRHPEMFKSQKLNTGLFKDPASDAHSKRVGCHLVSFSYPTHGKRCLQNMLANTRKPKDFPFSSESSFATVDKLLFLPIKVVLTSLCYLAISIVFSHPVYDPLL